MARDDARRQLAAGVDPGAARKAAKLDARTARENSFESISRQWLAHRASAWTTGTMDAIAASLENHVFPVLGSLPITDLQPRDVRDVVKAVEDAGAAETAGRVFQRLRSIFRYAIANDLASVDATYLLKPSDFLRPRETRHRPSFTEQQMPDFLCRLADYQGGPATVLALRLLLLTAVRPGELRKAR